MPTFDGRSPFINMRTTAFIKYYRRPTIMLYIALLLIAQIAIIWALYTAIDNTADADCNIPFPDLRHIFLNPELICEEMGVQGEWASTNAILTILVVPVREEWRAYDTSSTARRRISYALQAYKRMPHVNVLVFTPDCRTALLAHRLGWPTIKPDSGADVGDLTMNVAFKLLERVAITPLVGYVTGGMIVGDGLHQSALELLRELHHRSWRDVFAVAVRRDVRPPMHYMPVDEPITDAIWSRLLSFPSERYLDISADLYIWNRNWSGNWVYQPPFLIGGSGFDAWIVGWVNDRERTATVDLTDAVQLLNIVTDDDDDDDDDDNTSPARVMSILNSGVFSEYGMISSPDVKLLEWGTRRGRSNGVEIVQQRSNKAASRGERRDDKAGRLKDEEDRVNEEKRKQQAERKLEEMLQLKIERFNTLG